MAVVQLHGSTVHVQREEMGHVPYGKMRIRMMIQEIMNPPTDTETLPETPLEKEPCVPLAEVVKEMTAAGRNTIGNRLNEAVTWWRKLPRERQILFEFVGLSVVACLTMATVATLIARIFERR
jgi:hypothetical protein